MDIVQEPKLLKKNKKGKKPKVRTVRTMRPKRNVYSIVYNFQVLDTTKGRLPGTPVPAKPLKNALIDAEKRMLHEALETVRAIFKSRPIWSKAGVEYASKLSPQSLKYVLPCVAYFAGNGPWRSLWIRLGYDPRNADDSYLYQTIDFRVPGIILKFFKIDVCSSF